MQQHHSPVASQELAEGVQAPTTGPVVLDLSLQQLVSGGSPKGGWDIPLLQDSDPSPKGGW